MFHGLINGRREATVAVENLESRQLLSATLSGGVLTVTGTSGADVIEVQSRSERNQLKLELNGRETRYALSAVKKIIINGGAGNDWIEYSGREGGLKIPGSLSGGDGNDTLQGGRANDVISGGNGNDRIEGKNGNDDLSGGAGDDYIQGGNGNDVIKGEAGNDDLSGGRGNDNISGGDGMDDIQGNVGNDVIFGNGGNDDFDNSDLFNEVKDRSAADKGANKNV